MATIKEIVRDAAATQKNKTNNLKLAEYLRAAANLLEQEATAPVKLDFSAVVKNKKARAANFASLLREDKFKQIEQPLTAAGWRCINTGGDTGIRTYCNKYKPGLVLRVEGIPYSTFSIHHGKHELKVKTHLSQLNDYLQEKK